MLADLQEVNVERVKNITQAYSQAPWRKQLMFIGLFLLIVVFVALVAGIYLDVTARAATVGREIQLMQSEIEDLKMDNADLMTKLAALNSTQVMQERARKLGFEPIERDQVTFVVVPGYVPPQQPRLAPPPGPVKAVAASLPAEFTESLFDWIRRYALPAASRFLEREP